MADDRSHVLVRSQAEKKNKEAQEEAGAVQDVRDEAPPAPALARAAQPPLPPQTQTPVSPPPPPVQARTPPAFAQSPSSPPPSAAGAGAGAPKTAKEWIREKLMAKVQDGK
jgi:hypothetical protein